MTANVGSNKYKIVPDNDNEFDYGVIIKINNSNQKDQPNESLCIICAGIGPDGTEGAAQYLSNNWKRLFEKYHTENFGICIKVTKGVANKYSVLDDEYIKKNFPMLED